MALAYFAIGISLGLTLPESFPEMPGYVAWIFGGMAIIMGMIIHEWLTRSENQRVMSKQIRFVHDRQVQKPQDVPQLTDENGGSYVSAEERQKIDAVMDEVRMLRKLIKQVTDGIEKSQQKTHPTPSKEHTEKKPPSAPPLKAEPLFTEEEAAEMDIEVVPTETVEAITDQRPEEEGLSASDIPYMMSADEKLILSTVKNAIKRDRIDINLQPIVNLPQRKIRHYEVFTRIKEGDGSILLPDQYVALAERSGLIAPIDNLLLFRTIQMIRENKTRNTSVAFFCNISPATLKDDDFMDHFLKFMGRNEDLIPRIIFELQQDEFLDADSSMLAALAGLRKLGFNFCMDKVLDLDLDPVDLSDLKIKFLKVESDHLLTETENLDGLRLIQEIKADLDRFNIDLIVTKVETEQDLVEHLDLSLDFGQGFLFGSPRSRRMN